MLFNSSITASVRVISVLAAAVGLFCLSLTSIAYALNTPAATKTLTLKDAIFLALRYSPNVRSTELDRVVEKFSLRVAQNAFELQYALEGNLNISRTKSNGALSHSESLNVTPAITLNTDTGTKLSLSMNNPSDGTFYNPGVTLTVTQPLIQGANPNVVLAPLRDAYDQEIINRLSLKNTIISNVVTVITNYRSVISALLSLEINQASLQRAITNYNNTEKFIQAGQMPKMNLAQAKLSITESQIGVLSAQNQVVVARRSLLLSIGLDPNTPVRIPTYIVVPNYKIPDERQSVKTALMNDPTYQSDLLELRMDQRALLQAKDRAKWQLDATGRISWGNGSGGPPNNDFESLANGMNTSQTVGLQLKVPINDINTQAAIISAQIDLKKQQIATAFQHDTVVANVLNAIRTLETDQLSLKAAIEAVSLQKTNLSNAYKQSNAGQLDALSVSQQQNTLTAAEQNLLNTKISYLNNITAFNQLLQQTLKQWKIKIHY